MFFNPLLGICFYFGVSDSVRCKHNFRQCVPTCIVKFIYIYVDLVYFCFCTSIVIKEVNKVLLNQGCCDFLHRWLVISDVLVWFILFLFPHVLKKIYTKLGSWFICFRKKLRFWYTHPWKIPEILMDVQQHAMSCNIVQTFCIQQYIVEHKMKYTGNRQIQNTFI